VIFGPCPRTIVGWVMSERVTQRTLETLGMALARCRPPQRPLHHSDRGGRYASGDYETFLIRHALVCSRSRRADSWDIGLADRFFATLKAELIHEALWPARAAARAALLDEIACLHNPQRRHSSLGCLRPLAFARRWKQQHRAA